MKIEIENEGNTYEIRKPLNYEKLKNQICKNFNLDLESFENMYKIYYLDEVNDLIVVSDDIDYEEAINLFETKDVPKKFIINYDNTFEKIFKGRYINNINDNNNINDKLSVKIENKLKLKMKKNFDEEKKEEQKKKYRSCISI